MSSPEKRPPQDDEPSREEKVAFAQAMYRGLAPDSAAARSVTRKMGPAEGAQEPAVEIVRHIPATAAPEPEDGPRGPLSAQAMALAEAIEEALAEDAPQRLDPAAQQALIGALCRLYAAYDERGERFDALGPRSKTTATDVMVMTGALLEAVDLQVFELAVFQSWSSR